LIRNISIHPVLIGTFNRPPDSLNYTFDLIELSIDLAVDTGVDTIVVLGDFNEDELKPHNNKMSNIFVIYNMIQFINEPTHITKNSSSCIDLISSRPIRMSLILYILANHSLA
jgi:hypothetical protein